MVKNLVASISCAFVCWQRASAFVPQRSLLELNQPLWSSEASSSNLKSSISVAPPTDSNFWVDRENVKFPIFKVGKGAKQKVLNLQGLWVAAASIVTIPVWIMALTLEQLYMKVNRKWDENRSVFDKTGKIWAKVWLKLIGSYPTQSGNVEMLKGGGIGPCLYVANHGSWLDIPIVCTVLQPVFKFIAKGDLKNVPGIGQQLRGVGTDLVLKNRLH